MTLLALVSALLLAACAGTHCPSTSRLGAPVTEPKDPMMSNASPISHSELVVTTSHPQGVYAVLADLPLDEVTGGFVFALVREESRGQELRSVAGLTVG